MNAVVISGELARKMLEYTESLALEEMGKDLREAIRLSDKYLMQVPQEIKLGQLEARKQLRDEFAKAALVGILCSPSAAEDPCRSAYIFADAMLAERERQ